MPSILRQVGLRSLPITIGVADMNEYIERFFGSLHREFLEHIVALSHDHLRHTLSEYIAHYKAPSIRFAPVV